jgi:8-oxo-dGTP pyrophosphatase MutT (NUDIX family)
MSLKHNKSNVNYEHFGSRRKYRSNYFRRKRPFCCVNCGKEGHVYKQCQEPITSFGIIAFSRGRNNGNVGSSPSHNSQRYKCSKHSLLQNKTTVDTSKYVTPVDSSDLSYLMVQRKDTIGFIDFIRGKYPDNELERDKILKIYLEEMTCEERMYLARESFESLWDRLWINKLSLLYLNEYMEAKKKFSNIRVSDLLDRTECRWIEQEYGFPKGRKNIYESNLECAIREFQEETGYTLDQIRIINDRPWEENFVGTNGIRYRHIYYIAEVPMVKEPRISLENVRQSGEISNIGWFTYEQCIDNIRPYDTAKKQLITNLHTRLRARINNR